MSTTRVLLVLLVALFLSARLSSSVVEAPVGHVWHKSAIVQSFGPQVCKTALNAIEFALFLFQTLVD